MTAEERIKKALELAEYGSFDGGHHKMWTIDQMVRALTGCPTITKKGINSTYTFETMGENQEYLDWIKEFQNGEDGPLTYSWDTGIAP